MTTRSPRARALVLAKAPVAGRVKTRLGADVGLPEAAAVAAGSLLDSVRACTEAFGPEHCHLALEGDLSEAVRGEELLAAVAGWTITPQRGEDLGERIAAAHADVAASDSRPSGRAQLERTPVQLSTVQIGMDTPQVTPQALLDAAGAVADGPHDAALGPAEDGGWWVLALRDPAGAAALAGVPMSTDTTHDDTRAALVADGRSVARLQTLRDVDTVADAEAVAAGLRELGRGDDSEFVRAWRALETGLTAGGTAR